MEISFCYTLKPAQQTQWDPTSLMGNYFYAVLFWNHAEATLKQIVQLLLGQSYISLAIAAEMGNRAIAQAILVGSRVPELDAVAPHLKHLVTGFERLLGYRNFYVHGLYATKRTGEELIGQILSIDGKGQARIFNPTFTADDLKTFVSHIQKLIGYAMAIQKELGAEGDGLEAMLTSYQSSLEKPVWPPPLTKVPINLQAQVTQPLASEA